MVIGYGYGILRANIETPASHFIYDGAAAGLYLALFAKPLNPLQRFKMRQLMPWVMCLISWPVLLFLVPVQAPLIQLVGLRGQIFFLPFLLLGVMLEGDDLWCIAKCLAALNGFELAFAIVEVKLGVPRFFPRNAVDDIIYRSTDVFYGGTGHFRIPATFPTPAAYAGNMVASMPLLLGALSAERSSGSSRYLLMGGVAASALSVFLAASRSASVILIVMVTLVTLSGRLKKNISLAAWVALILSVGLLVAATPRMQRFLTLEDTDYVKQRISGSVNEGFLDVALKYPLGNGLGGGGTSVPYFLLHLLSNPVALENEYALIMLEEGIPGLMLWVAFIAWLLTRAAPRRSDPWFTGQWLARLYCFISFATAPLGTGMLSAIPQTSMLMLFSGWVAAPQTARMRNRTPRVSVAAVPQLKTLPIV